MTKICVVTTFPNLALNGYARISLLSMFNNLPSDITYFIQLDRDAHTEAAKQAVESMTSASVYFALDVPPEEQAFYDGNKDDAKDYRKQPVRFAHKVFAITKAAHAYMPEDGGDHKALEFDYIVWLDADILVNKPVRLEDMQYWMPGPEQICTYLGRKDWNTSETGFLAFNMKHEMAKPFIDAWSDLYVSGKIHEFPELTDAYAFDQVRKAFEEKTGNAEICRNLTENVPGRDVFDLSALAEYMTHYKGPRKNELSKRVDVIKDARVMHGKHFDVDNLAIQAMNCVNDGVLQSNVANNVVLIKDWADIYDDVDEEIVVCSAGPSLTAGDVLPWAQKGTKIVAVKHAMDRLLRFGVKPWAVFLLDPRPHVEQFIENADRDIVYFVASVVDPSVTKRLLDQNCKVIGYHAYVGGNIDPYIPRHHLKFNGGSATATRALSVLRCFGFKTMHLYGYDCCYYEKPDLEARKTNGKHRYEEVTLNVDTWGGKKDTRTIWTEGQFLAQVQEFRNQIFKQKAIDLHYYGSGVINWMWTNLKKHEQWKEWEKDNLIARARRNGKIEDFIRGTHQPCIAAG